jgi:hypothetical protein
VIADMVPKKINPIDKTSKKAVSILILSIVVFLYFAIMILLSKLRYDKGLISVLKEMLTIPALILLGISFLVSLIAFIKNKCRINDMSFYALIIQLVTLGLIVYIA